MKTTNIYLRMCEKAEKTAALKWQHQLLVESFRTLSAFLSEQDQQRVNHYNKDLCRKRTERMVRELLGGPRELGYLQQLLNARCNNILFRLKQDIPTLKNKHILLFSYIAAGLPNNIICQLLGLPNTTAVSVMHCRLRNKIQGLSSPYKDEYLEFLPKKACRIGQEMLYLHNLK